MNNTKLLLLGEVARVVRCQPHVITYLLTTAKVPEPALRLGNRRVFTEQDVERIQTLLKQKREQDD